MTIEKQINSNADARGVLFVVATPIGNLGDISQRALHILGRADRICAEDTRNTRKLLTHFGVQADLQTLHEHNEQQKISQIKHWLDAGENIALVSDAGTPLISDPGYHLVSALADEGYIITPIPGASAIIAALSAAGLPTDRFTFEGFLPAKQAARIKALQANSKQSRTQVYYESSHRIAASINDVLAVFGPERKVVLAREITKMFEQIYRGDLAGLQAWLSEDKHHQKGEFVLMLAGYAAKEESDESDNDAFNGSINHLLTILVEELSVKQAAGMAAKITGRKKNELYKRALRLKEANASTNK